MARFNKKKLIDAARKEGIILKGQPVLFTGIQRVYDFDVFGDTIIRRLKIVYFSNEYQIPNIANVYYGKSSKQGLRYNSYSGLVNQIKRFRP